MGMPLVQRHGFDVRPRTHIPSHDRVVHGDTTVREATPTAKSPTFGLVFGTVAVITGVAALVLAAFYVAGRGPALPFTSQPVARLGLAAGLGILVTAVHKRVRGSRALGYSLARAQTLLCVAGALTMILIDNSVARAFGIAGAASIVRFRTPVEDPTDATVLFLLMALGMASGVGSFGLALAGAAGVCLLLLAFGTFAPEPRRRNITIELVARGQEFPTTQIQRVFARYGVAT